MILHSGAKHLSLALALLCLIPFGSIRAAFSQSRDASHVGSDVTSSLAVPTGRAEGSRIASSSIAPYYHPQDGISFVEILQKAIESNGELVAARLDIERAKARMRQAGVRPNPTIDFEQSSGRFTGSDGEGETNIGISLPVELGGKRQRRIVSLTQSVQTATEVERVLKSFPEVTKVVSKTGRAEVATDPMGADLSDVYIELKPSSQWTSANSREELIEKMQKKLDDAVPGAAFSFSQPIELRVAELIAGVRSDVAIKLFGDDLEILKETAEKIGRVVSRVPGAEDVKVEQVSGLPQLQIKPDRAAIARYGINVEDVNDLVESIVAGKPAGQVYEGEQRFNLVVRLAETTSQDVESIKGLMVSAPNGARIPLAQLAEVSLVEGPAQISREDTRRRIAVELNVRGRDVGSFVKEAQRQIEKEVQLAPGYYMMWGGTFENLQRASSRLLIVVPLALLLIFILLFSTFGSVRQALLIYTGIPFAVVGGIVALFLRGMPFSISAGVGFIALFGVAVLNGVVMVSYINKLRQDGRPIYDAVREGAEIRLRPVLMTALVASLGFIPMALATSAGSEVQRPLATVVIGGLITSTLLTLLILPALYEWFERGRPREAVTTEEG